MLSGKFIRQRNKDIFIRKSSLKGIGMKRILWIACFWMVMGCGSGLAQLTPTLHPELNPSSRNSRELLDESMRLFDASYDLHAHLVLRPHDGGTHVRGHYMVRES